jgi:hypothetical protein
MLAQVARLGSLGFGSRSGSTGRLRVGVDQSAEGGPNIGVPLPTGVARVGYRSQGDELIKIDGSRLNGAVGVRWPARLGRRRARRGTRTDTADRGRRRSRLGRTTVDDLSGTAMDAG